MEREAVISDRRSHPRYDVVGLLWGLLELHEHARIVDVGTTGILIETTFRVALDSAQSLGLAVDGQHVTVNARVRHVTAATGNGSLPRYFVGLEFLSTPTSVLQTIERVHISTAHPRETEASATDLT